MKGDKARVVARGGAESNGQRLSFMTPGIINH